MQRILISLLACGVLGLWANCADLPEKWRSWHYSRPVVNQSSGIDSPVEVQLPWAMFDHCKPGCADLRIVDSLGGEVPFEMERYSAEQNVQSQQARIVENSFVTDHYTQIIGDLGEAHAVYDRVKVETDRPNFIVWAEVALSDDARTWRVVEPRAPIARFRSRNVDGTQTIPFQGLSSRYLRIRIADPSGKFPVSGISVLHQEAPEVQLSQVPATVDIDKSADISTSTWRATLHSPNQPVSQIQVTTDSTEFYRAVRLSSSEGGREWSYRGSGVIYRYHQGGKTRESLRIEFPEYGANRFLRLEVFNADDQPLTDVTISLSAVPRILVFKSAADRQYRLIYGNEKAQRAQYDLAHFLDSGPAKPVYLRLPLGAEEATKNYRDPRPFTERHPQVLWGALAVAILLIGMTAIKTLRGAGTNSAQS
jgi:hypothetical protein